MRNDKSQILCLMCGVQTFWHHFRSLNVMQNANPSGSEISTYINNLFLNDSANTCFCLGYIVNVVLDYFELYNFDTAGSDAELRVDHFRQYTDYRNYMYFCLVRRV